MSSKFPGDIAQPPKHLILWNCIDINMKFSLIWNPLLLIYI